MGKKGKKLTQQQFLNKLKKAHGTDITTSDKYINSKTKMVFHCNKGLGHKDWKTLPSNIINYGCPKCGAEKLARDRKFSQKEFIDKLHEKHGNSITCTDTYINSNTPIWFHCNRGLGHKDWKTVPSSVIGKRNSGCPTCNGTVKLTLKEVQENIAKFLGNTATLLSTEYKNANTPLKLKCNLCGNIWYPTYGSLYSGHRCNICKSSLGEQTVSAILEYNKIPYRAQYCLHFKNHMHRLDFVLKDINNNWCVIQPDGEQHFKQSCCVSREHLKDRQVRDRDENKYLPALGIRVLRIPYFWFDLDNTMILLTEFLKYDLDKPDKNYIPMYKKIEAMCKDYLEIGKVDIVANKYKVSGKTVMKKFKQYYGVNRSRYIRNHRD